VNLEDLFKRCTGFEWDDENLEKNWERHRVSFWEAEEVFFNEPLVIASDLEHSESERRFLALGQADSGQLLFISVTVRGSLIRVISARDMTRKEVASYEYKEK
jgi:uncharacterized DUF497 family protein